MSDTKGQRCCEQGNFGEPHDCAKGQPAESTILRDQIDDLMLRLNRSDILVHELEARGTSECERGRRDRVTPKMMSEVFAQSVNATDSGHEHLYDHRIAAELLNKMLAATSGTPAEHNPARAPHNKFASLWCDACPRPASGTPAARTEIFSKANRLAKATNQVVGEKHDLYVTLEQLMEIL